MADGEGQHRAAPCDRFEGCLVGLAGRAEPAWWVTPAPAPGTPLDAEQFGGDACVMPVQDDP